MLTFLFIPTHILSSLKFEDNQNPYFTGIAWVYSILPTEITFFHILVIHLKKVVIFQKKIMPSQPSCRFSCTSCMTGMTYSKLELKNKSSRTKGNTLFKSFHLQSLILINIFIYSFYRQMYLIQEHPDFNQPWLSKSSAYSYLQLKIPSHIHSFNMHPASLHAEHIL